VIVGYGFAFTFGTKVMVAATVVTSWLFWYLIFQSGFQIKNVTVYNFSSIKGENV
jgi:hypothetical protein